MSDFVDIFGEVLRIVTVQPREARVRYRPAVCEARMQLPEKQTGDDAIPTDTLSTNGKAPRLR